MNQHEGLWWLEADDIRAIHNDLLDPVNNPLEDAEGEYPSSPVEGIIARVQGVVEYSDDRELDVLLLATTYAWAIANSHSFVQGNKRTATVALTATLDAHGYELRIDQQLLADLIEQCADKQTPEINRLDRLDLYDAMYDCIFERDLSEDDSDEHG